LSEPDAKHSVKAFPNTIRAGRFVLDGQILFGYFQFSFVNFVLEKNLEFLTYRISKANRRLEAPHVKQPCGILGKAYR
jgi:hypothetical protein